MFRVQDVQMKELLFIIPKKTPFGLTFMPSKAVDLNSELKSLMVLAKPT